MMIRKLLTHNFNFGLITNFKGFSGWRLVKQSRALRALFLRVAPLAVVRLVPYWVKAIWNVVSHVISVSKAQHGPGLVKHLKVLSIVTQQAAGGHRVLDITSLGCRVSRTSCGLPRVIAKAHRKAIKGGCSATLRMYLTMFGLYRIIEIPGKVKVHTITALSLYRQGVYGGHCRFIPWFWAKLATRVLGRKSKHELLPLMKIREVLGYYGEECSNPTLRPDRILPIQSAGPMSSSAGYLSFIDPLWLKLDEKALSRKETHGDGVGFVLGLWRGLRPSEVALKQRLDKQWKGVVPSSVGTLFFTVAIWMTSGLLPTLIEWVKTFQVQVVKDLFRHAYTVRFAQLVGGWNGANGLGGLGKLAFLDEAAGKVRVVAMVDVVTQSILKPLHDWIFQVVKQLPMDGTFDQTKPIEILNRQANKNLFSYDLSSATDRLPLALQEGILGWFLGEKVARLWAALLVNREYSISSRTAKDRGLTQTSFFYGCGQPMGAYSSWAMLALTHHFCVQLSAARVYGFNCAWFESYALLGDDIVIADKAVAQEYLKLMTIELHVEIQETKSLISDNGSFEFAKRTVVRGNDATPISLKGYLAGMRNLAAFEGVIAKVPGIWANKLSSIVRACGFGYKALGSLQGAFKHRNRLRGLLVFLLRPGGLLSRRFTDWISMLTPAYPGAPMNLASAQTIMQSLWDWVGSQLKDELGKRLKNFDRKAGPGWVPTLPFPTRTLFDLYQKLVLRPITADLMELMTELEVLHLEYKDRVLDNVDDLQEAFDALNKILERASALPKDARVARCAGETLHVPRSDKSVALWQRFRRLLKKDSNI